MSVLIKDLEIPESCLTCVMYDYHYSLGCVLYSLGLPGRYNYDASKRPEWCELVELPETHGDLIDKQKLRRDIFLAGGTKIPFRDCDNFPVRISLEHLADIIHRQPIIIEREKE